MRIPHELQVFVDSISARQDQASSRLFGVDQEQLSEREYESLSAHVALDQCISCGSNGIDCQGSNFTFWREEDANNQTAWHGKRECVPVSTFLKNALDGISSIQNLDRGQELKPFIKLVESFREKD